MPQIESNRKKLRDMYQNSELTREQIKEIERCDGWTWEPQKQKRRTAEEVIAEVKEKNPWVKFPDDFVFHSLKDKIELACPICGHHLKYTIKRLLKKEFTGERPACKERAEKDPRYSFWLLKASEYFTESPQFIFLDIRYGKTYAKCTKCGKQIKFDAKIGDSLKTVHECGESSNGCSVEYTRMHNTDTDEMRDLDGKYPFYDFYIRESAHSVTFSIEDIISPPSWEYVIDEEFTEDSI